MLTHAKLRQDERSGGKRLADGSVRHDYCTHHLQISHPPPIHFPFSCSGGGQPVFVKVKVEQPTPNDTTEQFFHFFRSATFSLLSPRFPHLEAMLSKKPGGMLVRSDWLMRNLCSSSNITYFLARFAAALAALLKKQASAAVIQMLLNHLSLRHQSASAFFKNKKLFWNCAHLTQDKLGWWWSKWKGPRYWWDLGPKWALAN